MVATLQEAQADLAGLIRRLTPGEELSIVDQGQVIAKLASVAVVPREKRQPRQSGTMKGSVLYMAPDFDAPLEEFKEYMP